MSDHQTISASEEKNSFGWSLRKLDVERQLDTIVLSLRDLRAKGEAFIISGETDSVECLSLVASYRVLRDKLIFFEAVREHISGQDREAARALNFARADKEPVT